MPVGRQVEDLGPPYVRRRHMSENEAKCGTKEAGSVGRGGSSEQGDERRPRTSEGTWRLEGRYVRRAKSSWKKETALWGA